MMRIPHNDVLAKLPEHEGFRSKSHRPTPRYGELLQCAPWLYGVINSTQRLNEFFKNSTQSPNPHIREARSDLCPYVGDMALGRLTAKSLIKAQRTKLSEIA